MPVVWNAETEAKLLAGLFKVCDIKVSGEQLKELAVIIGPECTPKAVTHRLAKFKKAAGAFNGGKKGGDAAAAAEAGAGSDGTPEGEEGGRKKKAPKKGGKGGRKRLVEEVDEGEDDDGEVLKKPKVEEVEEDSF